MARPISKPCGTYAAARRHQRHHEDLCEACEAALVEYQHALYVARSSAR